MTLAPGGRAERPVFQDVSRLRTTPRVVGLESLDARITALPITKCCAAACSDAEPAPEWGVVARGQGTDVVKGELLGRRSGHLPMKNAARSGVLEQSGTVWNRGVAEGASS
jgi:hypothetical protein